MKKRRILIEAGNDTTAVGPFDYSVYADSRTRRMKMQWQNDRGLTIVIPQKRSSDMALKFMRDNYKWIETQQRFWKQIQSRSDVPDFKIDGHAMYRGKLIPISHWSDGSRNMTATFDEAGITLKNMDSVMEHIPYIVKDIMIRQAKNDLPPRIREFAGKLKVPVNRISIRDQRTRWGSWSNRQNISLNWRLIMLPDQLINYVLLHELTHSFHPNHSDDFWISLENICPGARAKRDALKSYVHLISLYR